LIVLKIPLFPGLNHFIWSGPLFCGPDRKFLVWTTLLWSKPLARNVPENGGTNHDSRFKPESVVHTRNTGLNQLPFGFKPRFDGGAQIRCRYSGIHTLNRTHRTVSDARRQPDTATRALSRLRSTWRGSEEADKARMRALPLTSPTAPHGEAARKPTRLACARSRSPVRPLHMARQRGSL